MSKLGRCKLSAGFQRLIEIVTGIVSLIYLPSLIGASVAVSLCCKRKNEA